MNGKKHFLVIFAVLVLVLLLLGGCGKSDAVSAPVEPVVNDESASQEEKRLTDEQAVSAVRQYCYVNNPDLESIVNAGEYPVYWDVASSDGSEIVVVFRSYTGTLNRYYVDPISGDTYVTEFVPGIMDEEQRTDESLNIWDYIY